MRLERLGWAAARITVGDADLWIDPLEDVSPVAPLMGAPRSPLPPVNRGGTQGTVLVTHAHRDHFDPVAIGQCLAPDAAVWCLPEVAAAAASAGLTARSVTEWERLPVAPGLFVTAVPAVDYRGDPQVSWIVDDGVRSLFHGGDTMWHGWWYRVRDVAPPVAAALLPVNGVLVQKPGFRPTGRPATLTPEEAVAATDLLEAGCLVPIHFAAFHNPPAYAEQPDIRPRLERAARERGVRLRDREPGTTMELPFGVAVG